jgi:hypothetical protein
MGLASAFSNWLYFLIKKKKKHWILVDCRSESTRHGFEFEYQESKYRRIENIDGIRLIWILNFVIGELSSLSKVV